MAFPPSFLEELRSRLTLSSVVGRKVKLQKAGREWKACCPFHNEKSPSFYVNDDKNFFHCFGCGAHGDVIGFAMRADHLAFPEAVEKLAGEAGLEVPWITPQQRQEAARAKTLADAVEAACHWFQQRLRAPEGRAALAYLYGRGLSDETIDRFRLGFAPGGRENLQLAMKQIGLSSDLLLEAGLIGKPDDGREPYDFFRNRVMFPISDRRGRVIAFGGRVMDDSKPKYLNSRDTPLFHKRGNLYALDRARLGIGEKRAVAIVAEGYMDVIALHQSGFVGAVAPLGTALTEEQILSLWRIHPEPIICLDGDEAGQRAALKAAETVLPLLKPGVALRFAVLPAGEDPDSLIKRNGAQAMEDLLSKAKGLDEVIWNGVLIDRKIDSPDRLASLEAAIRERLLRIVDPTVRRAYEREWIYRRLRSLGRVPMPNLQFEQRKWEGKSKNKPPKTLNHLHKGDTTVLAKRAQQVLVLAALNHPALFLAAAEGLAEFDFSEPSLIRMRSIILDWLHEMAAEEITPDRAKLLEHMGAQGLAADIDDLTPPKSFYYGAYFHGAFAREGANPDGVIEGFDSVVALLKRSSLMGELRDARRVLAEEMTAENSYQVARLAQLISELDQDMVNDDDWDMKNRSVSNA